MNAVVIAFVEKIDILIRQKTGVSAALGYLNNFLRHVSILHAASLVYRSTVASHARLPVRRMFCLFGAN
jgi:riboflavin transporter FmnP